MALWLYPDLPKSQLHEFPGIPAYALPAACANFGRNRFSPWAHRRSLHSPGRLAPLASKPGARSAGFGLWTTGKLRTGAVLASGSSPVRSTESCSWSQELSLGNPDRANFITRVHRPLFGIGLSPEQVARTHGYRLSGFNDRAVKSGQFYLLLTGRRRKMPMRE